MNKLVDILIFVPSRLTLVLLFLAVVFAIGGLVVWLIKGAPQDWRRYFKLPVRLSLMAVYALVLTIVIVCISFLMHSLGLSDAATFGVTTLLVGILLFVITKIPGSVRRTTLEEKKDLAQNVAGLDLSQKPNHRQALDSATGQTSFFSSADGAKGNESPSEIRGASPKVNSNKMSDLATGQPRFSRSAGGVITDSVTNLQWLPGPDQDTDYKQAEEWVASQTAAGGGWRLPTRQELKTLFDPSCEFHLPSSFKATGMRWVWAEPRDSTSAWDFNFDDGGENWDDRNISGDVRVFAVRLYTTSASAETITEQITKSETARFSRSTDGVITDSQTNLQWLPGPDQDIDYERAEEWVASQTVAGGDWRMPTREELKTLYDPSYKFHISPIFKATGERRWIWADRYSTSSAWIFSFCNGFDSWGNSDSPFNNRVFAVRSRK